MFLLPARGDASLRLFIIAVLMSGSAATVAGQSLPKPRTSRPRTIILPQKLLAGDPATLAVLDAAGRVISGAVVELSTGQKVTTDAAGRALFVAPSDAGTMTARILGQKNAASSAVVAAPRPPETPPVKDSPDQHHSSLSFPRFITLHDQFTIEGTGFNGRADANHVLVADQPCLVVASSPLELVVLPGLHIPVGPVSLRVRTNGQDLGPYTLTAVLNSAVPPNR